MGSLYCSSCETELLKNEDLFLFHPVRNEGHLAVKFERTEQVLNELGTLKLVEVDAEAEGEEKAKLIRSAVVKCQKCDANVAFRIHCGPNHDGLLCISLKTTFNVLADGSKLNNSTHGGAATRKKVLENIVGARDITEFYGSKLTMIKSESMVGTLRHPTIEDLTALEMNSLVKDRPRTYQVECFCAAALFSSIIQIPTGSGKTHISVMLTALYKRLNPNRMVWFLTDRVPLVFQQARYIEEQTSLTVLPLAGDVQTSLKPSQLIKYDVMVCTVQLLINMLVIGQLRIDDVSLVIVDEVHHAVRNHPYVVFIETFLSTRKGNDQPRFLGLTASPAAGTPIQMKLQLKALSRLCSAQLYTPCIYRQDLAEAVNRPNTRYIPVSLTSGDSRLCEVLFENVQSLLSDESCPCSTLDEVRSNLRGLMVKARQDHKLSVKLHKVHHFLTALEMTSILGSRYSREYLLDLLKEGGGSDPRTALEEKLLETMTEVNVSPKAQALCKILESIDLVASPETRMIVFVETKRTARWLASFLQEHLSAAGLNGWNPTAFTGQASNTVDGMNWNEEQRPILALFRSGHVRLLIATSVLQEGLDVAACNHIVLFDRTWSLKAFLQSRGRARAQDSEYTIICSADDERYYETLLKQEVILSKMVRDEMVDGEAMCLELAMTMIHLNVKCRSVEFFSLKTKSGAEDDDGTGFFDGNDNGHMDEEEDAEYRITLNLHSLRYSEEMNDGTLALDLVEMERKRDHLHFMSEQEQASVTIELPAIVLKSIRRSWIQLAEELLDPLLQKRFPGALIELNQIIPDLLVGTGEVPLMNPIVFELQRFAAGAFESANKFSESVSQHHSYTPEMSCLIFDPLGRKINTLFQKDQKTFRLEIAYDTIDCFCMLVSCNEASDDSNFSLLMPLKTPPLLFVSSEEVSSFEIEKKIDQISWERVTAASFSERLEGVFSVCPALKFDLFLNGMTSRKLFQLLNKIGSTVFYTTSLEVDSFPEFHSLWLSRKERFMMTLEFEEQYRLRAVMSETWSKTSMRLKVEWLQAATSVSNEALTLFTRKIAVNRFIDLLDCLNQAVEITSNISSASPAEYANGGQLVRLVTWTPSRIIHHQPTLFLSNRVLREFHADNFIRVHFRDENFTKLSIIGSNASIDNLLEVGVKGVLDHGIVIGERKFEFLAMSSSQLRGHGCWFVDSRIGAEKVRNWLGSFDEIRNVAKYVARLGQSFSASRPTLSVSSFDFVDDWEANGFCFSDGCGMISPQLAREISEKLGLEVVPSAFQIRFAGFKGVVAVNPESEGLSLRPSMKKFDTDHRSLDVLNIAEAFPCYLNRQVIMILSALGVPDSAFDNLQLDHLKYLAESFNSNEKVSLKDLNVSDLDPKDPFMRTLISAQYRQQLNDLLTKTRVAVPKGRILMGVIDESGLLAEDEIFCQISDDRLNSVIEGNVMIAKNPCMHPGDVRVLKAVRSPVHEAFSRNVLVFSRHGPRPVPNMCSGSDLDGDLYFITWDETLIPPVMEEPMRYDGLKAKIKADPITCEDLKEFLVHFIKNDQLGSIANTHVAFADQLDDGVRDPACMALAKLFSLAVDFPKTGFVATIPKEVRVEKYPDFMQKFDKPSYASHRIIGKLFREIRAIMSEEIQDEKAGVNVNKEFLVPGYEEYLDDARRIYRQYAMEIGECLTQYGFKLESHLLMSCTIAIDISIRELNADALEIAQLTFKHHVNRYREIFDSLTTSASEDVKKKMMSAWYYVAYAESITPIGLDGPILSFPWIIRNRPAYPRSLNTSLTEVIAQDLKRWFSSTEARDGDMEMSESIELIDVLSGKLSLLHQLDGILSPSTLLVCFREFLVTGSIVIYCTEMADFDVKILKAFPSAVITKTEDDDVILTIDSVTLRFTKQASDRSAQFSSQESYIKSYLAHKFGCIQLNLDTLESTSPCSFGNLVEIHKVPQALREWHQWILSADNSVYLNVSSGLIETVYGMIYGESEDKIRALKVYYALIRSCSIKAALAVAQNSSHHGVKSSVVRTILRNPRIMRQIGQKSPLSPTGRGVYVQGAAKMIFIGSTGEADLLRFEIYDGSRQIHHLTKVCYKMSLRAPQAVADDTFAYNEFWTHMHRQFHYLRKFGGAEYGNLQVNVKLGQIYATEIPKMFMEQAVSIWLARVALDKTFKSTKKRKSSQGNGAAQPDRRNFVENDLSQLKCNPRSNEIDGEGGVSSARAAQSLQSLLDKASAGDNASDTESEDEDRAPVLASKKTSSFGKMSTAFETVVSEEIATKYMQLSQMNKEVTLYFSLTCYDEASNSNTSFQLHYDQDNQLKKISQRVLRWAVVDVLSPGSVDLDARISISSFGSRSDDLKSTIFAEGIAEKFEESSGRLRVKEQFRSNPTIYARVQESYSTHLRDDLSLIIRKISESNGIDPLTGLFAISQEKWEVEAKMDLDWNEIHDYQYRDELISTLWTMARKLKRPF